MLNFLRQWCLILTAHQNHLKDFEKPTEAWAPLQTSKEGAPGVEPGVGSL